jgi:serine/threonine-protein kinase
MAEEAPTNPYGTGKLLPGSALGSNYVIVEKIAQGGMGAVYEVRQPTSPHPSRRLALKEMSFAMLKVLEPEKQKLVVDGFRREFELLSKLSHPNLVRAHDYFEAQGRQYYVMEYINGQTLETVMECQPMGQFLPVDRVLVWARQLCDVLAYLHDQHPPIIYRDLKPSNIMEVRGTQSVKLFDFGIARFYKPGKQSDTLRFGTNGYLAPEVIARRSQTNEQTDVYALGILLHQLLTRYDPQIDPFGLPQIRSINPNVPEQIAAVIERAISLDPTQRTRTARQMFADLFG